MHSIAEHLRLVVVHIGLLFTLQVSCKMYERCELARELRDIYEIPQQQIPTWICLARHESEFNTSAINPGSGDHGIFQISELFWCSPPGYACGVSCTDLRNDDIEDDVICARRVYREHKRLSGDGFNAWVVYNQYCKDQHYVQTLVEGCFDDFRTVNDDDDKPLPIPNYYSSPILNTNRYPTESVTSLADLLSTYQPAARLFKVTTPQSADLVKQGDKPETRSLTESSKIGKKVPTTIKTTNYAYTISKTGFKFVKT